MIKFKFFFLSLIITSGCSTFDPTIKQEEFIDTSKKLDQRSPSSVAYSEQKIGGTTIIQSGGVTTIQTVNGITVMTPDSRLLIDGSWSEGMGVSINRVLTKTFIPDKLKIQEFEMNLSDGNSMMVLALTADEENKEKNDRLRILWGRAEVICKLTGEYLYPIEIVTKSKWFSGFMIDISNTYTDKDGQKKFTTYEARNLSDARYFSSIVCAKKPKEY